MTRKESLSLCCIGSPNMASVTLANLRCGGAMHVVGSKLGRLKVSCASSQPSLLSFKGRSTWNSRNSAHHWTMNAFGLDTKRKLSQHATTFAIRNMSSSGDTQNNIRSGRPGIVQCCMIVRCCDWTWIVETGNIWKGGVCAYRTCVFEISHPLPLWQKSAYSWSGRTFLVVGT